MDDAELNRRLAEVIAGSHISIDGTAYKGTWEDYQNMQLTNRDIINYKDPAIFAENVKWLLSHGISVDATWEETMPRYFAKAIAMARIKAGEV